VPVALRARLHPLIREKSIGDRYQTGDIARATTGSWGLDCICSPGGGIGEFSHAPVSCIWYLGTTRAARSAASLTSRSGVLYRRVRETPRRRTASGERQTRAVRAQRREPRAPGCKPLFELQTGNSRTDSAGRAVSVLILSRIASSMNLVNGMPSRAEACLACGWISGFASSFRDLLCAHALLIMISALEKENLIFIDSIYQPMLLRNTARPCVRSL
jgi:hypothetical protein